MTTKTKKLWHSWLLYIIFLFAVVLTVNWWQTRNTPDGNLSEFSGVLMDDTVFSIADFAGQAVVLHFWATWCPICEWSNNSVLSISKDYPVITIASWSEGETQVKTYMQDNQLTFPVMLDNSGTLAQKFGIKGVPTSFILAPDGEIKFVETGYSSELGLRLRLWLATL